jgi:hypothetical protein
MRKGIFYSPQKELKALSGLLDEFDMQVVATPTALGKRLQEGDFEFVYLANADLETLQKIFFIVFSNDPSLPIILALDESKADSIPKMDQLYRVSKTPKPQEILSTLSFHRAKSRHELQITYDGIDRDFFFLPDQSLRGIVFADADDHIFYLNDVARNLLSYQESQNLVYQYLNFEERVVIHFEDERSRDARSSPLLYESVNTLTNQRVLSVLRRTIAKGQQKVGTVYYLEDAEERQADIKKLNEERRRFEHLASRLNDVLLKDVSSHAYQFSYLKRKLDLEINRAKRSLSQVAILSLILKCFSPTQSESRAIKSVLSEINELLLQEYPDPHVLGLVRDGHWVIVVQNDGTKISRNSEVVAAMVLQILKGHDVSKSWDIMVKEETDLKIYQSGDELITILAGQALASDRK